METFRARNGDVEIAFELIGDPAAEPLLLIMGLGGQMIVWPDEFCLELVAAGFAVARFDNRDVGLSTHFREAGMPGVIQLLTRPATVASYSLTDMAGDAVAVLDALGWSRAHVVGASLGGMIAQTLAIDFPERVATLTSIMSTPDHRIGRPTSAARRVLRGSPATERGAVIDRAVQAARVIGSPGYPFDEVLVRCTAGRQFDRSFDPAGGRRQLAAVLAAPDRRPGLARVRIPALVLHGGSDPMIRPAGGRATAAALQNARLILYPGMGHNLPRDLWPQIIGEIRALSISAAGVRLAGEEV